MKNNPFLSPDFQKSLSTISDIQFDSSALYASLAQMAESIDSTIRENITANMNTILYNLSQNLSFLPTQQELLSITSKLLDCSKELSNSSDDDYVIVDEQAIKTYELPDSVYIPVGNSRIKIPTSILFSIIETIISAIISISIAIASSDSSVIETQNRQLQVEEAQFQLQCSQNEILRQLLHDIDTSSSSEAQSLKELQETVEELHKQYSQTQDTCLPVEEGTDNSKSTEDTDTQEK